MDVVAHGKYWILITVQSGVAAPQSDEDTFRSLLCVSSPCATRLSLFFPPSLSFTVSLSPPAVRDNYFQTSGPLGEAVLSKAAFIKNSRSCTDVFALR